jgi:hypothetical protein
MMVLEPLFWERSIILGTKLEERVKKYELLLQWFKTFFENKNHLLSFLLHKVKRKRVVVGGLSPPHFNPGPGNSSGRPSP